MGSKMGTILLLPYTYFLSIYHPAYIYALHLSQKLNLRISPINHGESKGNPTPMPPKTGHFIAGYL